MYLVVKRSEPREPLKVSVEEEQHFVFFSLCIFSGKVYIAKSKFFFVFPR